MHEDVDIVVAAQRQQLDVFSTHDRSRASGVLHDGHFLPPSHTTLDVNDTVVGYNDVNDTVVECNDVNDTMVG